MINIKLNRTISSNILLVVFIVFTGIVGGISDFFQKPTSFHKKSLPSQLFPEEKLSKIIGITIKNPLGEFKFYKNPLHSSTKWNIISPQTLPAKDNILANILTMLNKIKVKKVFPKDTINLSTFSLTSPLFSLSILTETGAEDIKFGLVNPIDNSTYIEHSSFKSIFHIDSLNTDVSSLNISDFIDSRIFKIEINNISNLTLYKGSAENNIISLMIKNTQQGWSGKKKLLNEKKTLMFLDHLVAMRSGQIIDEVSDEILEKIEKVIKKPLYTIILKDKNHRTSKYIISPIIYNLSELKIEKKQYFLIKNETSKFYQVVHKDNLKSFWKKERNLY